MKRILNWAIGALGAALILALIFLPFSSWGKKASGGGESSATNVVETVDTNAPVEGVAVTNTGRVLVEMSGFRPIINNTNTGN